MPERSSRRPCCTPALLVVLLLPLRLLADSPGVAGGWKFDVLRLKSGNLTGLFLGETSDGIRFQVVRQNVGQRTFIYNPTVFPHSEVLGLLGLKPEERQQLTDRLKRLDPSGQGERQRMNHLELEYISWGKDGAACGLCYHSQFFVLESNAREDIVRRAAVRLEDIYAAYSIRLPPRRKVVQPTRILLLSSPQDFTAYLQERGLNLFGLFAFYDPAHNQVVCASELRKLGDDLAQQRELLAQNRAEWREVEKLYIDKKTGKPLPMPASIREDIRIARERLDRAEALGEKAFHEETKRLFKTLYHEAFHAYLANAVYPGGKDQPEVPRWLNEGLAQIFENAIVEAGDLRVGHADEERLKQVKASLNAGTLKPPGLVPLAELLKAPAKQFLAHGDDRQLSNRLYLTSWALAFYLTFERQLLATDKLDQYVRSSGPGIDPLKAFEKLVGQPLPVFEKAFHHYLRGLRPNGTVGPVSVKEGAR